MPETPPVTPLPGYILIEPLLAGKVGSFVISDNAKEMHREGRVIAVGGQIEHERFQGTWLSSPCTVGDVVIAKQWGSESYFYKSKEYKFVAFKDIVGQLHE